MLVAALLGGVFVGVLSALPFVNAANCCCLWIFTGGLLAAYVLQQNEAQPLGPARGALVGLGAGASGAVVWLVCAVLLYPIVAPFERQVFESLTSNASDLPSEVRDLLSTLSQPGSAPVRFAMEFAGQFLSGAIFSTLGGLVGSAVFRPPVPDTPDPPGPHSDPGLPA